MPELPEVENIRRGLQRRITHKVIDDIEVRHAKVVRMLAAHFRKALVGRQFTKIERRGKLLILSLDKPGTYVLTHMKMTGQLIYHSDTQQIAGGHNWPPIENLPNKFTHVIVSFVDGTKLYFNDMRRFGYWQIADAAHLQKVLAAYGPEPLDANLSFEDFAARFAGRTISIKAALLNQQIIAGIGNIYADEICFAAKVRPSRRTNKASKAELKAIFTAMRRILHSAVEHGGTTFHNYRDAEGKRGNYVHLLKVYGKAGQTCPRCKQAVLVKIRAAGRGTVYCPNCQS
jgi:formamidopyrimidine-DNA glycosylase